MNVADSIVILGDFNLPFVTWSPNSLNPHTYLPSCSSLDLMQFLNNIASLGLYQLNWIQNYQSRILDLCFTDNPEIFKIFRANPLSYPEDCYHPPMEVLGSFHSLPLPLNSQSSVRNLNFRKMNSNFLLSELQKINWNSLFTFNSDSTSQDLDRAVKLFNNKIIELLKKATPFSKIISNDYEALSWFPPYLRKLRNFKTSLFRKYMKNKNVCLLQRYIVTQYEYRRLVSLHYKLYLNRVNSNIQSDPKSFWEFINSKRRSPCFPRFLKLDSVSSDDSLSISEMFASFFKQSFHSCTNSSPNYPFSIENKVDLKMLNISHSSILDALQGVKVVYHPGPDGIPSSAIKACASQFAIPLTILFNQSLRLGYFPSAWKSSFLIPLHKSGSKIEVCNYRPIAKLSVIPKIFEKLIANAISFDINNQLNPNQHGFRQGKSTVTNLFELTTRIFDGFKHKLHTDVIYTDFSKAFDKVNHLVLLQKLKLWGFGYPLLQWMSSYLCGRSYCVLFKTARSKDFLVHSGVPQGSHLGPLLFNIFMDDLPNVISYSNILMYADDVKIFLTHNNNSHSLQADLSSFYNWCMVNSMQLNFSKCRHVCFSRSMLSSSSYLIDSIPIETLDCIKDLGVIMDRQVRFHIHINTMVNKAYSVLGFIKRWSKEFNDPYTTKLLYVSLVRPILEYASEIWSPSYQVHIDGIESVQKQFLLFCLRRFNWNSGFRLPPYRDRLKLISITSLHLRRKLHSATFVLKLLTGHIDSMFLTARIFFNVPIRLTRNYNFIHVQTNKTNFLNFDQFRVACLEFNSVYSVLQFNNSPSVNRNLIIEFLLTKNY